METREKIRQIELETQDYFHALLTGSATRLQESISEFDISKFCRNCDCLQENGICRLGSNSQGRYAIREQCGWASMGEVRGEMTENGFTPYKTAP